MRSLTAGMLFAGLVAWSSPAQAWNPFEALATSLENAAGDDDPGECGLRLREYSETYCSAPDLAIWEPHTAFGKVVFNESCVTHDYCYRHGARTYGLDQSDCDDNFLDDNTDACDDMFGGFFSWKTLATGGLNQYGRAECYVAAGAYYTAVWAKGECSFHHTEAWEGGDCGHIPASTFCDYLGDGAIDSTAVDLQWRQLTKLWIRDVAVSSTYRLWGVVGLTGVVNYSDDSGATWTYSGGNGFARIAVAPNGDVWAVGQNGTLWTKPNGAGWVQKMGSGTSRDIAIDAAGSKWLLRTDGRLYYGWDGVNYITTNATGVPRMTRISTGANDRVWASAENGDLWMFDMAPWAWRLQNINGVADVAAHQGTGRVTIAGLDGSVWVSETGGAWFKTDGQVAGDVAMGPGGEILLMRRKSTFTIQGALWMSEPVVRYVQLGAVSGAADVAFAGPTTMYMTGTNGTLWWSTNSGKNWSKQSSTTNDYARIGSSPTGLVWVVTKTGGLERRTATHYRPALTGVADVAVRENGTLFMVMTSGSVYYSSDSTAATRYYANLGNMRRIGAGDNKLCAVGKDGSLWVSTNGTSWTDTGASGADDCSIGAGGRVWMTGTNGTVWVSDAYGAWHNTNAIGMQNIAVRGYSAIVTGRSNATMWYAH